MAAVQEERAAHAARVHQVTAEAEAEAALSLLVPMVVQEEQPEADLPVDRREAAAAAAEPAAAREMPVVRAVLAELRQTVLPGHRAAVVVVVVEQQTMPEVSEACKLVEILRTEVEGEVEVAQRAREAQGEILEASVLAVVVEVVVVRQAQTEATVVRRDQDRAIASVPRPMSITEAEAEVAVAVAERRAQTVARAARE